MALGACSSVLYIKEKAKYITIASPGGGPVPIDPVSEVRGTITASKTWFKLDEKAMSLLSTSIPVKEIKASNFDLLFIVGRHGYMWDLKDCKPLHKLLKDFVHTGKPIAAVGSGVIVLISLPNDDDTPFVKGKKLTAYSNAEVELEGQTYDVPFLLELQLLSLGAFYSPSPDYSSHVATDGMMVTEQNPASSADTATATMAVAAALGSLN